MSEPNCEHCDRPVDKDSNGWWVGDDETSDCPENPQGHTVNGSVR